MQSFKEKENKNYYVKLDLHRVQMRQLLIGSEFAERLIDDFNADSNFRAVIRIESADDKDFLPQSEKQWALSNSYASKGTLKGSLTAAVLKGLNELENQVMETIYKKRTADTLVSLLEYLAHERQLTKGLLTAIEDVSYSEDDRDHYEGKI